MAPLETRTPTRAVDWTSELGPVRRLTPDELAAPVGLAGGPWEAHPMASLVMHISREVLHHGAEVLLLRDLHRSGAGA